MLRLAMEKQLTEAELARAFADPLKRDRALMPPGKPSAFCFCINSFPTSSLSTASRYPSARCKRKLIPRFVVLLWASSCLISAKKWTWIECVNFLGRGDSGRD